MIINENIAYLYIINNKVLLIIALIFFNLLFQKVRIINLTNIPELFYHPNQTLQIIAPDERYKDSCSLTLYFTSYFRKTNISNDFEIKQINLKDKNYFVSYFMDNNNYYPYIPLLNAHGLIRSNYKYGYNNLIISGIKKNSLNQNQSNSYDLSKYQKVYQYLSGNFFFQKNILYRQYLSLKKSFIKDFDYMPETFNYPDDKKIIEIKFSNYILNLSDLWLVKPTNKCAGEGIKLFKSLKDIKYKEFLLTKYITNIDLINGKKYDLRLYILTSGLRPLRIYFYKEGLVRIASEKYSLDINNIGNKFMHLTNTDLNKLNKKFVHPKNSSFNNENSNMWNLFMYKNYLKNQHNIEWEDIREKIKDIIIKTIITNQQSLIKDNEKKKLDDKSFYNLFGFDILIRDDFKPILLEVNNSPEMRIHNDLDRPIKTNLFVDTLNIIGISPYSRTENKSLNTLFKYKSTQEENIENAICELKRQKGDYELIFPLKTNINLYKKYFINNSEENINFWNKILD